MNIPTDIVLSTNNTNKRIEISDIFKKNGLDSFRLLIPEEVLGYKVEVEETGVTLEENALLKAKKLYELTHKLVISDDSGLEIEYLNNAPGVYSSTFAGENATDAENRRKVLDMMKDVPDHNRKARFRTVICLIKDGVPQFFDGICNGQIISEERGTNGFGYDPIFLPVGYNKTFAEMLPDEKNSISHRAIAINKLAEYLKNQFLIGSST